MNPFTTATGELLARLADAGVPATADPDQVAAHVSASGVVAYIQPPRTESRVLGRGMRLHTEVYLLGSPPGGYTHMLPVWEVLGAAMDALRARTNDLTTQPVGGVTYPGYLLTTTQNTPC